MSLPVSSLQRHREQRRARILGVVNHLRQYEQRITRNPTNVASISHLLQTGLLRRAYLQWQDYQPNAVNNPKPELVDQQINETLASLKSRIDRLVVPFLKLCDQEHAKFAKKPILCEQMLMFLETYQRTDKVELPANLSQALVIYKLTRE